MIEDLSRTALLFPGQGSHEAAAAAFVRRTRPELLETLAAEVAGDAFTAADTSTAAAPPAILRARVAAWHALGRPRPKVMAGHSLGELSALVAAGALDEHDGIRLAAARGRAMQAAADASPGCGMLAARGAPDRVAPLVEGLGVVVANQNTPEQTVLSGGGEAIDAARKALRAAGVKATRLFVAGAFHSPVMEPAVEPFRAALAATEFRPAACPVVSAVTGEPFGDAVRDDLAASLIRPVRWQATIEAMAADGVSAFVEVGPGTTLTTFAVKILGEDVDARTTADLLGSDGAS